MRRICAVLALSIAAPLFGVERASAGHLVEAGDVTALSVKPAAGRADVHISVNGTVKVQDFTLDAPNRIVLDLSPARLASAPAPYDMIPRGGIVNIRSSQYGDDIVRIVLELDGRKPYQVVADSAGVRVQLQTEVASFAPWLSAAPVAGMPAEVISAEAAQQVTITQQNQDTISVSYDSTSLSTVLSLFAARFNRTILPSAEVRNIVVTGDIVNQPWMTALESLLDAHGFAMIIEPSGIIKVDTYQNIFARRQSEQMATRMLRLSYSKASVMVENVKGLLYRDCSAGQPGVSQTAPAQSGTQIGQPSVPPGCIVRGSVTADTTTNTLIINEVASQVGNLVDLIQSLDIRTPQVSIKAKIYLVNRTSIEDIGVSYDIGTSDQFFNSKVQRIDPTTRTPVDINGDGVPDFLGGGTPFDRNTNVVNLGGNALSAVSNASTSVLNPALQLIYSTMLGKFDFTTFLDLLQESRLADVQAEPSVTTLDNHEAVIFMGERTPIRTIQPQAGNSGVVTAVVQFEETGIRLRVTPHVTANRQISMKVAAERSSPEAGTSDIGLIFTNQNSSNTLLVEDGQSAVIGGITVSEVSVSKLGIPLLVDLPFIGKLFGQTTTRVVKRELLILVTPHIVDAGAAGPGGDR